jgi:hypothetical protein
MKGERKGVVGPPTAHLPQSPPAVTWEEQIGSREERISPSSCGCGKEKTPAHRCFPNRHRAKKSTRAAAGESTPSRRATLGPRGTVARPLDGGALTLRWARAPARGPTAAPSASPLVVSGQRAAMAAARVVVLREKGRGKRQEKGNGGRRELASARAPARQCPARSHRRPPQPSFVFERK